MKSQQNESFLNLLAVRILVSYLGEKNQFNWWDTNFLSPIGLQFTEINFPRTSFSAACTSVIEAARRLHDQRIGRGGVFHLFRLPYSLEQDLHQELLQIDPGYILDAIKDSETALNRLREYADTKIEPCEGPVLVGSLPSVWTIDDLQKLTTHYFHAFLKRRLCFPYLSAE
jgi:hypothetical protein